MKKDKVIVNRFNNGYSVEFVDCEGVTVDSFVFEVNDDGLLDEKEAQEMEVAAFVKVLQCVDHLIGPTTGGFSPKVIRIVTEKGDELE